MNGACKDQKEHFLLHDKWWQSFSFPDCGFLFRHLGYSKDATRPIQTESGLSPDLHYIPEFVAIPAIAQTLLKQFFFWGGWKERRVGERKGDVIPAC